MGNARTDVNSTTSQNIAGFLIGAGALVGAAAVLSAAGVLIYQIYIWLKFGSWPAISIMEILDKARVSHPHSHWIGVQTVLDFVMQQPASLGFSPEVFS